VSDAAGALRDQVAVVTGAGRGIGRAIALGLAAAGATVALIARSEDELTSVAEKARGLGGDGIALPVDCMDGPALRAAVAGVAGERGRLDVLVNNVGGLVGAPEQLTALGHDDALFECNVFLNLTSAYYATRAALPPMAAAGHGRIVNIGSAYATHGGGRISYSAAKHGLVGLTRSLAYEVPAGITVNCLCPGWTATSALATNGRGGIDAARAKAAVQSVQPRILDAVEIVPMALLLCGPGGGGITGQAINVDGGYKV
jgi:NAD(P)-dependent dehydrogenase (short-subunit alcohol dehydrogenase family)